MKFAMASKEELRQRQNALLAVHDAAKAELMQIPGVIGVGIGLKQVGGKLTDQICFRVYVHAKKSAEELPAEEIIPAQIQGFPTDVLKVYNVRATAQFVERRDQTEHRPLTGGVAISTKSVTQNQNSYGTLGWFATKVSDNSNVVLTNKHVLWGEPPPSGVSTDSDKLSQPLWEKKCCCEYHVVGERLIGIKQDGLDCAIGRLNSEETPALHIGNRSTNVTLKVAGTDDAIVGVPVKKIGARSGFTEGVVIDIEGATQGTIIAPNGDVIGPYVAGRQILVWPADNETYIHENGKPAFANHGDSGAVLLDTDNKIVGLIWGDDPTAPGVSRSIGAANHIAAVLKALKDNGHEITLRISPPGNNAGIATGPKLPPRRTLYDLVRESDTLLAELGRKHREEVAGLIDHCRPVTVAWHRHHGPAFAAAVNRNQRDPRFRIPHEINGVSRSEMLVAMARVLDEHGSFSLREDLREYGLELMDDLCQAENIHAILFPPAAAKLVRTQPG
jgi:hypothetical protein